MKKLCTVLLSAILVLQLCVGTCFAQEDKGVCIALPQEEGIWNYSIAAEKETTSPFVFLLTENMKGVTLRYDTEVQPHEIKLSVIEEKSQRVVYETTLSVLKGYEQEIYLPFSIFEEREKYKMVLSAPSIQNAQGVIKCSAEAKVFSDIDPVNTALYTATKQLNILGILHGYSDGRFMPDKAITRAEMAKLAVVFLSDSISGDSTSPYTDVGKSHPLYDYICTATRMGLFCGHGDGTFAPEDSMTYSEAIKVTVCMLGYAPLAESTGGYPHGYFMAAADMGLTKNLTIMDTNEAVTRGDISILLYNALYTPLMEKDSDGKYVIVDGKNEKPLKTVWNTRYTTK